MKEKTRCAPTSHLAWAATPTPRAHLPRRHTPLGGVVALLKALVTGVLRPKGLRLAAEEVGGDEVRGGCSPLLAPRSPLPPPGGTR